MEAIKEMQERKKKEKLKQLQIDRIRSWQQEDSWCVEHRRTTYRSMESKLYTKLKDQFSLSALLDDEANLIDESPLDKLPDGIKTAEDLISCRKDYFKSVIEECDERIGVVGADLNKANQGLIDDPNGGCQFKDSMGGNKGDIDYPQWIRLFTRELNYWVERKKKHEKLSKLDEKIKHLEYEGPKQNTVDKSTTQERFFGCWVANGKVQRERISKDDLQELFTEECIYLLMHKYYSMPEALRVSDGNFSKVEELDTKKVNLDIIVCNETRTITGLGYCQNRERFVLYYQLPNETQEREMISTEKNMTDTHKFDKSFINQVKNNWNKKRKFDLRVGNVNKKQRTEVEDNMPPIHYQQGRGMHCVGCSLASALHYLGHRDAGSRIFNNKQKMYKSLDTLQTVCDLLEKALPSHMVVNVANEQLKYDPFCEKRNDIYITLLTLTASDGGRQHAVTTVGDLLFDSNCTHAMPVSKKIWIGVVLLKTVSAHLLASIGG